MLRPEMKPVDGTPGVGRPSKPKREEKPAPLFPWLVPQPRPEPEPEPEVTSVTAMINLVPTGPPAPPSRVQQIPAERISEPSRPSQKVRLGEEILRRNEERARQDAVSQSREQSFSDLSDLEVLPDISETGLFQACDHLCDQHPELARAGLKILKGFDPVEDDEEVAKAYMRNHLRLMGLNDAFGQGGWYIERLGPTASSLAEQLTDIYFDLAKISVVAALADPAIDEAPMPI